MAHPGRLTLLRKHRTLFDAEELRRNSRLPVKLVLALDQPNAYALGFKFGVKRQVRCRVDHLQLVGASACSPGTSLWSAPIHDLAGIGSVPIRLPNRDRIERTTS